MHRHGSARASGSRRLLAALAVVVLATLVAVAALAGPTAAAPSEQRALRDAAERALKRVERLMEGHGVHAGRELTPALLKLALRLRALPRREREEGKRLLMRPSEAPS